MAYAYWSSEASWRSGSSNQDGRLGTPGILNKVLTTINTGETYFTGSNYGYGAIMKSGSYNGTITLSEGGTVACNGLSTGVVYEFSPKKISGGTANTGGVHAFKKR